MYSVALVPFVVANVNVTELRDTDLDVIVDLRIFNNNAWCNGRYECIDGKEYQCSLCHSIENWGLAARIFGDPHPRLVPRYTKNAQGSSQISKAIHERGMETRRAFMDNLATLLLGQGHTVAWGDVTPRMTAVAALQALEIVDQAGYIIKREGVQ